MARCVQQVIPCLLASTAQPKWSGGGGHPTPTEGLLQHWGVGDFCCSMLVARGTHHQRARDVRCYRELTRPVAAVVVTRC